MSGAFQLRIQFHRKRGVSLSMLFAPTADNAGDVSELALEILHLYGSPILSGAFQIVLFGRVQCVISPETRCPVLSIDLEH